MNTLRLIRLFGPVGGKTSTSSGDIGYSRLGTKA